MGGPRKPRCKYREHDWQPTKRGAHREQCTKCGDVFPCRTSCEHYDCCAARGDAMPASCHDPDQTRETMLAELAIIAPSVLGATAMRKLAQRSKATVVVPPPGFPVPKRAARAAAVIPASRQYTCTVCGELGHNARRHAP